MESQQIRKMFKLKDFDEGKKCLNLLEYITSYFKNNCPSTHYGDGTLQCYNGCNRSFYDLYFISKSKFPKTTRQELAYVLLYNLDFRSSHKIIGCIRCPNISKLVFYGERFHSLNGFNEDSNICDYGYKEEYCCDGLTFNDFVLIAEKYKNKIENGTVRPI